MISPDSNDSPQPGPRLERIADQRLGVRLRHMALVAEVTLRRNTGHLGPFTGFEMRDRDLCCMDFLGTRPRVAIHAFVEFLADEIPLDGVRNQRRLL